MRLRDLWDSGAPTLGGWCSIPSGFGAELLGHCGFDWVCVDTQHGIIGYDQMVPMLQGLSVTGTPAFVRVSWNAPAEIMKALDAGAQGVIVPMVNSRGEATQAVRACKYAPQGIRSYGPTRAALGRPNYSRDSANRETICVPMKENGSRPRDDGPERELVENIRLWFAIAVRKDSGTQWITRWGTCVHRSVY